MLERFSNIFFLKFPKRINFLQAYCDLKRTVKVRSEFVNSSGGLILTGENEVEYEMDKLAQFLQVCI